MTFTDLMEKYPTVFGPHINDMYTVFSEFHSPSSDSTIALLEATISILLVANKCESTNFQEMHAAIFPRVIQQIIGEQNKETGELINRGSLDEYSCSDFSDMADAFSLYVKAYSGYVVRTGDMSSYQETTQQLLQMGQQLYVDIMTSFKREFNDIDKSDELDAEEKQAEMEDLFDSFDAAVDSLGAGYCNFVMQYREKLPGEILQALVKAADLFMERNVESDNAVSQTMQGISLYSDFAEFLPKEMVSQVFPQIYPRLIQYLKERPDEW